MIKKLIKTVIKFLFVKHIVVVLKGVNQIPDFIRCICTVYYLLYIYKNNELYRKINNNRIRDNPTTGFVLIRTYQAGFMKTKIPKNTFQ